MAATAVATIPVQEPVPPGTLPTIDDAKKFNDEFMKEHGHSYPVMFPLFDAPYGMVESATCGAATMDETDPAQRGKRPSKA